MDPRTSGGSPGCGAADACHRCRSAKPPLGEDPTAFARLPPRNRNASSVTRRGSFNSAWVHFPRRDDFYPKKRSGVAGGGGGGGGGEGGVMNGKSRSNLSLWSAACASRTPGAESS